jgi:hypothetical protein
MYKDREMNKIITTAAIATFVFALGATAVTTTQMAAHAAEHYIPAEHFESPPAPTPHEFEKTLKHQEQVNENAR